MIYLIHTKYKKEANRLLRQFQAQEMAYKETDEVANNLENSEYRCEKGLAFIELLSTVVTMSIFFISFIVGSYLVKIGLYSVAMMMSAIQLVNNVVMPLKGVSMTLAKRRGSKIILDKINSFSKSKETNVPTCQEQIDVATIKLEGAALYYNHLKAVHNINLVLERGKNYAIIGESGSGKTSLLNLIAYQSDLSAGRILINSKDIRAFEYHQYQQEVALMEQNTFLFNDSIYNNITLFAKYTNAEIENSLNISRADQVIHKFKEGMDYVITDNGKNLSGGEKQRLALARIILRKSKFVLLDESFSALDKGNSYEIINSLLSMNASIISVFHNAPISILKRFDSLIILRDGEIIEQGSYEELMLKKGELFRLESFI